VEHTTCKLEDILVAWSELASSGVLNEILVLALNPLVRLLESIGQTSLLPILQRDAIGWKLGKEDLQPYWDKTNSKLGMRAVGGT
jgi:hypothetical protein